MRQVPIQQTYVIIGDGRVARHFCYYLSLLDISYQQWSRSDDMPLDECVAGCSHVLFLISDSAIASFICENPCLMDKCCVHFSGSLVTDLVYGAHPLMTFGSELYTLEDYLEIPWITENTAPPLSVLLPGLPNPTFSINKSQKDYYHALCVMSNNFTTLLWQKFFTSMAEQFDIPKVHLIPILKRTMQNIMEDSELALTGPLVRGDQSTIDKNINALSNDAFQCVYKAFIKAYETTHHLVT